MIAYKVVLSIPKKFSNLANKPEPINAWGDLTSTLTEEILSKQVESVNQESPVTATIGA